MTNVFEGRIQNGQLYIGDNAVLHTGNVSDRKVYAGIRPEGFLLQEDGPLCCELGGIEVMGRDISIVSRNKASLNPAIRSIIGTDNKIDTSKTDIRFSLVSRKVFLFDRETEERIDFT